MSDDSAGNWFGIIDTARDPELHALVKQSAGHQCLIAGEVEAPLDGALPYLVRLDSEDALGRAWRGRGAGRSWGIMFQSPLNADALRRHFKKFLQAKLPDGMVVLFRFYDPRVFNTYLRAALPEEREPWFRDVARYAVEGAEPGQLHRYHLSGGRLYDGDQPLA